MNGFLAFVVGEIGTRWSIIRQDSESIFGMTGDAEVLPSTGANKNQQPSNESIDEARYPNHAVVRCTCPLNIRITYLVSASDVTYVHCAKNHIGAMTSDSFIINKWLLIRGFSELSDTTTVSSASSEGRAVIG